MSVRSILVMLVKPFLGKRKGQTKAEALSLSVEAERVKSALADLTQLPDEVLAARFGPPAA
jgi:hypothetical protein